MNLQIKEGLLRIKMLIMFYYLGVHGFAGTTSNREELDKNKLVLSLLEGFIELLFRLYFSDIA
jgi:hypothetical protein